MTPDTPPVVCIVGKKNAGKTSLTVALAAELNRRGHRVMTIKHGHGFQVDRPGRDSWRHRHEGGALRTVMAGPRDFAVVGEWPLSGEMDPGELARRFLWDADIVLAEGFKASSHPRIELQRGEGPLLHEPGSAAASRTLALVTDRSEPDTSVLVLPLNDPATVPRLAEMLEKAFMPGDESVGATDLPGVSSPVSPGEGRLAP